MTPTEADGIFKQGAKLLFPYLHFHGQHPQEPNAEEFNEGIRLLESIQFLDQWQIDWFLGKAYEAKHDYVASAASFERAYALMPTRREVLHECLVALLRVNKTSTAEAIVETLNGCADPMLRIDMSLVKFQANKLSEALHLLDGVEWPIEHRDRAAELRRRIERHSG